MKPNKKRPCPMNKVVPFGFPLLSCFAAFGGALAKRELGYSPSEIALRILPVANSGVPFRLSAS